MPYLPGGIEESGKFAGDECGHSEEHDEFYKVAGVNRLNIWIWRSPPGSGAPDLEMVGLETENPAKMLKEFGAPNHQWAIRFQEYANKAYGIDFSGPLLPLNESIVDLRISTRLKISKL